VQKTKKPQPEMRLRKRPQDSGIAVSPSMDFGAKIAPVDHLTAIFVPSLGTLKMAIYQ